MTKNKDLLPCPFCNGQPSFSAAEWKDENRYVGMSLECCATISKGIGWRMARDMTADQHTVELQRKLAESWNNRPQAQADARAAELLGFLQDQCIDLRCFTTSDGEDVGWRTVQHHMSEPRERVVSEVYGDKPRRAIREAMARIERDPYCTGPLHLEDDAAIAAAKGEGQ
ncbi:hypothetical protein [Comamonas testosteroni]|uniref:hypothetical protein n=1 Tax=Comamonas testosteroni TaxID=285 RepID=UPI0005B548E4|nr:hypothetical protein [Comamonas testosteroni]